MKWTADTIADILREYIGDIDPSTKKGQRRLAILETATPMFAEQGYRQTSMDEIARAVGIGKGTLYLYFPTKFDLLAACAALEKLRWVPEMLAVFEADGPPGERVKQWITSTLLLPSRSPLICRLLEDSEMAALLADYPKQLLDEGNVEFPKLMRPLLEELAGPHHRWSEIELHDRAHVIRSLSYIAPMLRHEALRPGMSAERFAAILADLIVDGLRPRAAQPPTKQDPS